MALSRIKKLAATGTVVAATAGIVFGASAAASTPGDARRPAAPASAPAAPATRPPAHRTAGAAPAAPHKVSRLIAHGRVDGQPWSVTLEFYPTWPEGFSVGPLPPGLPQQPVGGSLLCQRMFIGGVRIDHQGGPWSDCQPVDGTQDPSASGSMGLWGSQDKGTSGTRLFVSDSGAEVAYGVMTFADGRKTTAPVRTVPGTGYHAWAVAIRDGRTIAVVDEYDAHHHLVSHSTEWR
ncbi:hypothetical protein ACFO3J_07620 [Streptomyces polygonati]|uniref:Uncharacterized protein n=1 Tax=Streptomyces polygonati TaxID=1617087 RepID=A0ABV8HH13_9ACTN